MSRCVVTLNAGSSSIKFALFEAAGEDIGATLKPLAIGLAEMVGIERRLTIRDGAGAKIHEATRAETPGAPFHAEALRRILAWRQGAFPDAEVVAAGASRRPRRRLFYEARDRHRRGAAPPRRADAARAAASAA
jgi:acetate kinase